MPFYGYRVDGSIVYTEIFVNGLEFQTYSFGSDFNNLLRVEISTSGWSLDNLVVVIPEPGTGMLLAIGGLTLAFRAIKRRKV